LISCIGTTIELRKKIKSSRGQKYTGLINPFLEELFTLKKLSKSSEHIGEGLKYYTENPVEYMYINNLNQIINQLCYISAEERAGNNNFHNEKLACIATEM
jgi:hypothetical protein